MPEEILERIVRAVTNAGDVVLDPFAGSGTTLAAALKHGRHAIGIEINRMYVTGIRKRLQTIDGALELKPDRG